MSASFEVIIPPNQAEEIPTHAGDVAGDHDATVVTGIQGIPVNATAPTVAGETWVYDSGAEEFVVGNPTSDVPDHEGDVTGAHNATVVVGLRGLPISPAPPSLGDFLVWDGAQWVGQALADSGVSRYLQVDFEFKVAANQPAGWYRPAKAIIGSAVTGLHGNYSQSSGGSVTAPASYTVDAQDGLYLTPPSPYTLDAVSVHHDGNIIGTSNWGLGLFDLTFAEVDYEFGASGRSAAQYQDADLGISHQNQYFCPMIWVDATNGNGLFGRITLRFKA